MSKLRRHWQAGRPIFLTLVTFDRRTILLPNSTIWWDAVEACRTRTDFNLIAWVIMPEHLHLLLDHGRGFDTSGLVQRLKMSFAARYRKANNYHGGRVWQHRFWDHMIRNEIDMNRHLDYIHYNPVKHGLVTSPFNWTESSLHQWTQQGYYERDWGRMPPPFGDMVFGE